MKKWPGKTLPAASLSLLRTFSEVQRALRERMPSFRTRKGGSARRGLNMIISFRTTSEYVHVVGG